MEKLRNLLLYGGAMPDVYRNCRDEIRKENLEKLFFFLTVEIVFLLIALAVCCAVKSLAGGFIAYIIALAGALVLLCTVQSCQNSNIVLSICADSFLGSCYLLSLYLGCFAYPDEPAICFHPAGYESEFAMERYRFVLNGLWIEILALVAETH